jgi:hypothetical protein
MVFLGGKEYIWLTTFAERSTATFLYSILRLELERIDGNIRQLEKEAEAAGSSPLGKKSKITMVLYWLFFLSYQVLPIFCHHNLEWRIYESMS